MLGLSRSCAGGERLRGLGGGADERMMEEIVSREPTLLIHVRTPGRLNVYKCKNYMSSGYNSHSQIVYGE